MSTSSVTFDLPPDASYTTGYDSMGNPYYIMTTSTVNAPYLANLALSSLSDLEKSQIPSVTKEAIIRGTGTKNLYSFPSVLRWSATALATGIAIKALSKQDLASTIENLSGIKFLNSINCFPRLTSSVAHIASQAMQAIDSSPFMTASIIAASSFATGLVSDNVSVLVSDTVDGVISYTKRVFNAVVMTTKTAINTCINYPKTTLTAATVGLSYLYRENLAAVPSQITSFFSKK